MFKKILLGTFWGYICASVFLILYRFFFGGGSRFLDGDFTRYDFSTILPSFLGYIVLAFGFFVIGFIIYFLIFKLFHLFKKNKKSLSKEIIYYSAFYIFVIILVVEFNYKNPPIILLNRLIIFILPLILNIIYFYFKYKIHDN